MQGKDFEVDLTNCDKEPIHIPGKIQPHGCILAVDKESKRIVQASANTAKHIGVEVTALLDQNIADFIDENALSVLKNWEQHQDNKPINLVPTTFRVEGQEQHYNMIFHLSGKSIVLEFEPLTLDRYNSQVNFYHYQNSVISRYQHCKTLEELCQVTAEEVKALTGYDRVMLYKFDESYNGKVISEVKEDFITTFLGHHFPASDIPKQARELYLKNWVRILPDRDYEPVSLVPELHQETGEPLDLSLSTLRSVSPVHIEYLQNMGVQATLVISIVQHGKLWGLISCHHYSPKFVDYHLRASCEFLGKIFSYNLFLLQESKDEEYARGKWEAFYKLKDLIANKDVVGSLTKKNTSHHLSEAVFNSLTRNNMSMLNLNDCHGAMVAYEGGLETIGRVPPTDFILPFIAWLKEKIDGNGLFYTNHLSILYPDALNQKNTAAGVLAVCINPALDEYLIWFKSEVIQTEEWAGNPNKPVLIDDDHGMRLTPRKSFEKWSIEVDGKSLPWKQVDRDIALRLREAIRDIKIEQKEELEELNNELEKLVQNRTWELKEALHKQQELNEELMITEEELRVNFDQVLMQHQDLQQYADELAQLLNGMPQAVIYVDEEGAVVKINEAFTNIFGYQEQDILGQKVAVLFPSFDFTVFKKKYNSNVFMKELQESLKGAMLLNAKGQSEKRVQLNNQLWNNKESKRFLILYISEVAIPDAE